MFCMALIQIFLWQACNYLHYMHWKRCQRITAVAQYSSTGVAVKPLLFSASRRCSKPGWVLIIRCPFSLNVDLYSCSCVWFLWGFSWPHVAAQSQINKDLCWQLLQKLLASFRDFFFPPLCAGCRMQAPQYFFWCLLSCAVLAPGAWQICGFSFLLQISHCKDRFLLIVDVWLLGDWKGNVFCCVLPVKAVSRSLLESDLCAKNGVETMPQGVLVAF